MTADATHVAGFICFDHVAVAAPPGELETHVKAYRALGFTEIHREDVLGTDQVREVLLRVGDGPNLVQLLEPLAPQSPVARQIERNGGRGGSKATRVSGKRTQSRVRAVSRTGRAPSGRGSGSG